MWLHPFLLSNAVKLINSFEKTKKCNAAIVTAYLLLKLVKYKLYDDIILEPQNLCHPLSNPWLDDFQVHFGHVHLGVTPATQKGTILVEGKKTNKHWIFAVGFTQCKSDKSVDLSKQQIVGFKEIL